ncbi:hypothetical protein TWF506_005459 [Arthrobotrys conoides]|uniref:F-box domain-containing protein n=1 Tax=Arthrobotrys conoides TaxID=74498 RepID=A0AAN8NE83_9PEZI
MSSTTALSVTPEILDSVFEYLDKHDIWALALTCKVLLQPCLRSIWQTLEVTSESPIRRSGYRPELKENLSDVIEKYWVNASWLRYIKFFNIGRYLNSDSPEASALLELLESGKMRPNRVELIVNSPSAENSLLRLKAYSESRSQVDFSINLVSTLPLATIVDLPKVTHLAIQAPAPPSWAREAGMPYESWIGQTAKDLAMILDRTTNLKHFEWVLKKISSGWGGRPFSAPHVVVCLQDAFRRLKHVTSFHLYGFFLHPTLFITPPPGTQKLRVDGMMSQEWWEAFANCPLAELKSLTLRMEAEQHEYLQYFLWPSCPPDSNFRLKAITVCSLKKAMCQVYGGPPDLMDCLLRRNPNLQLSAEMTLKFSEAEEISEHCTILFFETLLEKCEMAAEAAYTRRALDGHKPRGKLDFITEFANLVTRNAIDDTLWAPQQGANTEQSLELEQWCRAKLQGCLESSLNQTLGAHMKKLESGRAGFSDAEFFDECVSRLKTLMRKPREDARNAEQFVSHGVQDFSKQFKSLRPIITDVFAEKLAAGEEIGILKALDIWLDAVVRQYREFYRVGYLVE